MKFIVAGLVLALFSIGCGSGSEGGSDAGAGRDLVGDLQRDSASLPDTGTRSPDLAVDSLGVETLSDLVADLAASDLPTDLSGETTPDLVEDLETRADSLEELVDSAELIAEDLTEGEDETGGCLDVYPGQVIFTELMLSPAGDLGQAGRFIELFNAGWDPLLMKGWVLEDGVGGTASLEQDTAFPGGGYLVLGFETDPQLNGGLSNVFPVTGINPASGTLYLWAGQTLVDMIQWDPQGEWSRLEGASRSLSPEHLDLLENDLAENWCRGRDSYGPGGLGSPGQANPECPGESVCGDGFKDLDEACDDGANQDPCDGCLDDCTLHENICGDGFRCGDEACDDGDSDPCDGCLDDCTEHLNICGDGFVCGEEECDAGDQPDAQCTDQCKAVVPSPCPPDMVQVPQGGGLDHAFCLDRWEASRQDATFESVGVDGTVATSRPGVMPWFVNPVSLEAVNQFQAACGAAGKRLCLPGEWSFACSGTQATVYSFGNEFDPDVCKSVQTSCEVDCTYGVVPTGSFPNCVDEFGAQDINGNIWEVVPSMIDGRGFEVHGGAFNCGSPNLRFQCTFNAGWNALYAGFRCCKDLPPEEPE